MENTVYSKDLGKANSEYGEYLSELISNLNSSATTINNFIEESKTFLTGEEYDAVRTKLSIYAWLYTNI